MRRRGESSASKCVGAATIDPVFNMRRKGVAAPRGGEMGEGEGAFSVQGTPLELFSTGGRRLFWEKEGLRSGWRQKTFLIRTKNDRQGGGVPRIIGAKAVAGVEFQPGGTSKRQHPMCFVKGVKRGRKRARGVSL